MQEIKKPNFLIIGAAKAGTTSLWYLLRQHPDIFMPEQKEPAFFSWDNIYERGWDWYLSLFQEAKGQKAIGEATSHYCQVGSYPEAPRRILKHLPNVRLIYIVRHPLERMKSAYIQSLSTKHPIPRVFKDAVRNYLPLLQGSTYWTNLEGYRHFFSDEQILLLFFKDFKTNPGATLDKCFRFLEVDPNVEIKDLNKPRNPSAGKMTEYPVFSMLKKAPVANTVRDIIPSKLKSFINKLLRWPIPSPNWDEETRQWVIQQLSEEIKHILEYGGKPANYWKI